jgi:hypothetical protein
MPKIRNASFLTAISNNVGAFYFSLYPSGFGLQHTVPTRIYDDKSYLSRKETRPLLTMATVQVLYILASHIASQLLLRIIAAIFAGSPFENTRSLHPEYLTDAIYLVWTRHLLHLSSQIVASFGPRI